jgi:hypothetical protein
MIAFGLLLLVVAAAAQEPINVQPCDLVLEPQNYDGKVVRVRGRVHLAFEDFSLDTPGCAEDHFGVWLVFGGDEPTPTTSTVNDTERTPGSVLKLEGREVPLQRDASLELFRRRLIASRSRQPDGSPCEGRNCYLYDVTATFTGIFAAGNRSGPPGYGHLACSHLLAIQQVASVEARRTEVPAGGVFACPTDTWEMKATEVEQVLKASDDLLQRIAEHWRDRIDISQMTHADRWGDASRPGSYFEVNRWRSRDLLALFTFEVEYNREDGELRGAIASREVCRPRTAPYPMTTPIGCVTLRLSQPS